MMICNAIFLVYTGALAPLQICFWSYDDPCNNFPTLFFDVFVDSFFLVLPSAVRPIPDYAKTLRTKSLPRLRACLLHLERAAAPPKTVCSPASESIQCQW
jgi:hypothetical protein